MGIAAHIPSQTFHWWQLGWSLSLLVHRNSSFLVFFLKASCIINSSDYSLSVDMSLCAELIYGFLLCNMDSVYMYGCSSRLCWVKMIFQGILKPIWLHWSWWHDGLSCWLRAWGNSHPAVLYSLGVHALKFPLKSLKMFKIFTVDIEEPKFFATRQRHVSICCVTARQSTPAITLHCSE